jgi:hypothetical protein
MSKEEGRPCLFVTKGRCGKPTEKTSLQCFFCVTSGLGTATIDLVRGISSATIRLEDAGHILDVLEHINRFLDGMNKLITEKYANSPEFKEMLESHKEMRKRRDE